MAEKRGPGRPPLDEHDVSVHLSLRMPSKQYDDLCERAEQNRVSVPEQIRRDLRLAADKETQNR